MEVKMKLAELDAFDAAVIDFRKKLIALENAARTLYETAHDLSLEISQPTDTAAD